MSGTATQSTEPWSAWFRVGNVTVLPEAPVASVSRNAAQLDLFVVGLDGGIYTTWWNPALGWDMHHNWFRIDPTRAALPGSPVTAIARQPDLLDLFMVDFDGGIYTNYWNTAQGWHTWFRIGALAVPPKSNVVAVSRGPEQIDLFVVAKDGSVHTTFWNPELGWDKNHDWFELVGFRSSEPYTASAVAPEPGTLALFSVKNMAVYNNFWSQNGSWHSWVPVGPRQVTATSVLGVASGGAHVDLFVTGIDGDVDWTRWHHQSANLSWSRPDFHRVARPGSLVSGVARDSEHLDIFMIGFDDRVYTNTWDTTGRRWSSWRPIGDFTVAKRPGSEGPGGSIAAVARDPSKLDLFAVGDDGGVYSTFWSG